MLFNECDMVNRFLKQVEDNENLDLFCDAFSEFIYEMAQLDLSENTLENLFQLFLKDQNIYFKNKKELKMEDKKICSICGREFVGFGNNAYPINNGICCDGCNSNEVIPARIAQITKRNIEEP